MLYICTLIKILIIMSKVNLEKHVWEGWRVVDFINNLEPIFNMIMNNQSYIKPFTTPIILV